MAGRTRVGIVGGGAVGLAYAYFLAGAAEVVIKTRSQAQAENINQSGIRVTRGGKTTNIKAVRASEQFSDLNDCEVIIIAVKSYDTKAVAPQLSEALQPETQIVSLQNGLQAFDILRAKISDPDRVFAGVTYIGARRTDERSITLGQYHRTVVDPRASVLIKALQATQFGVETPEDIKQAVWDKMVLNTGQNALSAITDRSAKQMLDSVYCLEVADNILREFLQVAAAEGLSFKGSLLEKLKYNWDDGDDFYPSMWQDLHKGNRTEIDALNGAIAELGKKHTIPTPYNSMITALIKARETLPNEQA